MVITIKNDYLEAKIESFGAELIGLRDLEKNKEYMWQKDPKFWSKSSPVLFPFVGGIKGEKYRYNGKEYEIKTKHGFARDYEFELVKQEDNYAEFLFKANSETMKIYPFNFKLYLKYSLKGKKLEIEYRVENLEDEKMYFSLGAHPAFSTPLENGSQYEDYYLEFNKKESGEIKILNGAFIDSKRTVQGFDGNKIILTKDRFINDAMIIENPKSDKVYLKNDKVGYNLAFEFPDFKYIAFWNVPGAEYVCLEPWNGISDYDNCTGELTEKKGIEVLEGKGSFIRKIKIEIL